MRNPKYLLVAVLGVIAGIVSYHLALKASLEQSIGLQMFFAMWAVMTSIGALILVVLGLIHFFE